jgi:hypothetical protein
MLASMDPLYHVPSRQPIQDVLTCVREHVAIANAGFLLHVAHESFLFLNGAFSEKQVTHPRGGFLDVHQLIAVYGFAWAYFGHCFSRLISDGIIGLFAFRQSGTASAPFLRKAGKLRKRIDDEGSGPTWSPISSGTWCGLQGRRIAAKLDDRPQLPSPSYNPSSEMHSVDQFKFL